MSDPILPTILTTLSTVGSLPGLLEILKKLKNLEDNNDPSDDDKEFMEKNAYLYLTSLYKFSQESYKLIISMEKDKKPRFIHFDQFIINSYSLDSYVGYFILRKENTELEGNFSTLKKEIYKYIKEKHFKKKFFLEKFSNKFNGLDEYSRYFILGDIMRQVIWDSRRSQKTQEIKKTLIRCRNLLFLLN